VLQLSCSKQYLGKVVGQEPLRRAHCGIINSKQTPRIEQHVEEVVEYNEVLYSVNLEQNCVEDTRAERLVK